MTTDIVVAQNHPTFPAVAAGLEQRMPSIVSFLGGNEAAADRFRRVVLQSLVRNPDLLNATPESLISAAAEAAQLGLEPSGAVGGAWLIRYGPKAQLVIDFRGLIQLARRSNEIEDIYADAVREKDHFVARRGLRPDLEHEPDFSQDRGPSPDTEGNRVIHVYAVALFKSGHRRFEVMSRAEVDAIRARSRAANNGPWVTDWIQMALKTVTRRLCKTLPLTAQAKEHIALDEEREYGGHRVAVEEPAAPTGSLVERLRAKRAPLGATEQPAASVPAGEAAEAAEVEAGEARATVSTPSDQPEQGVGDPAPVSKPTDGGVPAEPEAHEADDSRGEAGYQQPRTGSHPVLSSPAASSTDQPSGAVTGPNSAAGPSEGVAAPLQALLADPSAATFMAFARDVLGMDEGVALADLSAADLDEVIAAAIDEEAQWTSLFNRLPRDVRSALRGMRQHPRGRTEGPKREAAKDRPTAEQPKASLGGPES